MYDIWKMDAVNELEAYNARKQALLILPERIGELEAEIAGIHSASPDGIATKGGGSGREDRLLNSIVARDKLVASLAETRKAVDRVERALNVLSEDDRRILEVSYIMQRKGAADQLAAELGVEKKTVYNRRIKALWLFQNAMSGKA